MFEFASRRRIAQLLSDSFLPTHYGAKKVHEVQ